MKSSVKRVARSSTLVLGMLVLVLVSVASGTTTASTVRVTIRKASCRVGPQTLDAGAVSFLIANRSGRPASFRVAAKRSRVAAGRTMRMSASLSVGSVSYVCLVAGRPVARGALVVTPPVAPSLEHQIAVHDVGGYREFYDRTTGARYTPRGNNYIRLAPQIDTFGRRQVYHSTFIVGEYDATRAEAALSRMQRSGYNVVRVFLNNTCAQGCSSNMRTGEISPSYVANLVDFLRRAKKHDVLVMLTAEWLGAGAKYDAIAAGIRRDWFDNVNLVFLSPQGVQMSTLFWQGLIGELVRQRAPLDAIFAYSLWNEAAVTAASPPFTLASGRVTTANGQSYDMASSVERKRMIDDAFVFYIDQVRSAIRRIDPTALVTMGFFHDTEPNPARRGDDRLVRTRAVIERSSADFVDIHPYPGDEIGFEQLMQNYGIDGPVQKPIVIGEMGASRRAFPTNEDAANALLAWQRRSCSYGIDGWLLWTWDSNEQPDLWNALTGGGVIEAALAPSSRPNPCT